jgi:hypothetical protein
MHDFLQTGLSLGKITMTHTSPVPPPEEENARTSSSDYALVLLEQLHIDFARMKRLDEAGPLLHRLMEIAYNEGDRPQAG